MARVTAEEALKTRERLLDAALEVFWEDGVSRPSLSKVAARAGVTRGAVYGHFKNKEDVFDALCERILMPSEVLDNLREERSDDPLGLLREWIVNVLHRTRERRANRMLMEIILTKCEAVKLDAIRERLRYDDARSRHHEQELLRLAVQKGQLPADLDIDLAATSFHAFLGGLLRYSAINPNIDYRGQFERLGQTAIDMLRSPALRLGAGDEAAGD